MRMSDKIELSGVKKTKEGFLTAFARCGRSGIQIYTGDEVGRPDLASVRVYRAPDQVFDRRTMTSFAHIPITVDHPGEFVTPENWREHAVGETGGDVMRDGEFARVSVMIRDKRTIDAYEAGERKELSLGYETELKWQDGKTAKGEEYDAIQTGIYANHLAIVTAARGGSELNIGDDNHGETKMKVITLDGVEVKVDDAFASYVEKHCKKLADTAIELTTNLAALQKKYDDDTKAIEAKRVTEVATKDAEIVTLKKQVDDNKITPEKLQTAAQDHIDTVTKARAVIGDKLVIDKQSTADIRKQVVLGVVGDPAKTWGDAEINASFNTLTAGVDLTKGGTIITAPTIVSRDANTGFDALISAFAGPRTSVVNNEDKSYAEMVERNRNAWKGPQAAAAK